MSITRDLMLALTLTTLGLAMACKSEESSGGQSSAQGRVDTVPRRSAQTRTADCNAEAERLFNRAVSPKSSDDVPALIRKYADKKVECNNNQSTAIGADVRF